jgi:hypothetical protein
MPLEVINKRIAGLANKSEAYQLQLALNGLIDAIRVITTKLDNDATVTDVNYTSTFDANVLKS